VIEGKPTVEARLRLLSAESGGLHSPTPTGTRSPLPAFAPVERRGEDVKIGAVIDVIGGPALVPGTAEAPVVMRFWADGATVYATPGASFTLWYGRAVGTGVVTRIVDEVASFSQARSSGSGAGRGKAVPISARREELRWSSANSPSVPGWPSLASP
jgi:hypothetical protein